MNPPVPPITGGAQPPPPGSPGSPFNADGTPRFPDTPDAVVVSPPHWQRWWHYNRDSFLNLSALLAGRDTQSYASAGQAGRPEPATKISPLLQKVLLEGGDTQMMRGSLLALAQMPIPTGKNDKLPLSFAAHHFLKGEHPPTKEAAVLAMGIAADPATLDDLLGLLLSNEHGVELVDDLSVDPRTRSFAAYALALFAQRTEDEAARERIGRAMLETLVTDDHATFELHNALIVSLGLVPLPPCDGTDSATGPQIGEEGAHMCIGIELGTLMNYFKDEENYAALRAHVAPSLARLAAVGLPEYKEEVAKVMFESLESRSTDDPEIKEGVVIGLGMLADCDSDATDKRARQLLLKLAQKDDTLTGRLAMVSLARVCARPGTNRPQSGLDKNLKWIERELGKPEGMRDSWAALSLAVMAHDMGENGVEVPAEIPAVMRATLKRAKNAELSTSLAVGLGLLRDLGSEEVLRERFLADEDDSVRGAAALALGLLEAKDSAGGLRKALDNPDEDPGVVRQVAIALRLLGDREAAPALLARLDKCEDDSEKETLVSTLGILHDQRAVPAISSIITDDEADDELRGVAAFALAELANRRPRSWSEPLSSNLNYGALSWTLESPFEDGSGVLDMRWW